MTKINLLAIFLVIFFTGLFVRLYRLSDSPPHLSNDEISIAYDAYSLVRTGADEHFQFFPISFRSHGSYKAPLYHYLLAPLVLIFGNTDTVAKLPSVVSGILTICITSLITYQLTRNKYILYLSSLSLSLSLWHIYTSRMVLESNVALLFLSLGVLLFLKKNPYLSSLSLSLSMYAYHTQWGLVPLIVLFMFFSISKKSKKTALIFLTAFTLLSLPLFTDYLSRLGTYARANVEVIWSDPETSAPLPLIKTFISNYLSYINPGYLFFSGLTLFPSPHPYNFGLFLWPLIIPFFIGIINLKKYLKSHSSFFIYWTLASPIVPALTHGGTSLIRNLPSLLPYTIIIALGLYQLYLSRRWTICLLIPLSFLFFILFSFVYLYHFPVETAATYQGYKPIAEYVRKHPGQYSEIRIDYRFGIDAQFTGVPLHYFAYFNSLDPRLVQYRVDLPGITYFGPYAITRIDWATEIPQPGIWYVSSVGNRPTPGLMPRMNLEASFPDAGGRPAFEIWTVKNR